MSSSASGGRDEQEGLAAVRRICEEYKEAKGNFAKHVYEYMHNHTQPYKGLRTCALVLVCQYLKIKGRAAAVWFPQACFYSLYQAHTHKCTLTGIHTNTELPCWLYNVRSVVEARWGRGGYKGKCYEKTMRGDESTKMWGCGWGRGV